MKFFNPDGSKKFIFSTKSLTSHGLREFFAEVDALKREGLQFVRTGRNAIATTTSTSAGSGSTIIRWPTPSTTMLWKCYNCGKSIADEPAMEGIKGLLCFPCRYKFDAAGGEEFVLGSRKYEKELPAWEEQFGERWRNHKKLQRWNGAYYALTANSALALFVWCYCTSSLKPVQNWWPVILISFLAGKAVGSWAKRYVCPNPPTAPCKPASPLGSNPKLFFDDSCPNDGSPEFVNFPNGYPPDWPQRQAKCLQRDGYRCRLCGATERLHIHHVKPISFAGTHSLQNLITLCSRCHMRQEYYEHRNLVEQNIRAKRRYTVKGFTRSDGVAVRGHLRRVGRRGRFWRRIRRKGVSPGYCRMLP